MARHCKTNQPSAYAYFFFDGKNGQKGSQTVESLIRSLIRQFSTAYGGVPAVLTKLYHSCHDGGAQPSVESLQATLLPILEAFNDVYIVLDALDECAESVRPNIPCLSTRPGQPPSHSSSRSLPISMTSRLECCMLIGDVA